MKKLIFLFFLIILFAPLIVVWAQEPVAFKFPEASSTDIAGYINSFYNTAVLIAGIVAVAMIVIGAIYYTISGGSQDKQREGKDIITSAIWGVVLLLGAYVILNTINPELVSLSLPGGPAPFCKQPVDPRDPCTPEQESDPEAHGCCISQSALVEQGIINCPQEIKTACESEVVVPVTPSGEQFIWVPNCDTCEDNWDKWDKEILKTGGKYRQWVYYPKNQDPREEHTEVIYNPNNAPEYLYKKYYAQCVPYAYQKEQDAAEWETGGVDLDGLIKC